MSITQTYPFDNPANYALVNAKISGGSGSMDFIDKTGLTLSESFDSDAGFTYDAGLTEFAAGVMRQLDRTPSNSIFAADYAVNGNLNWHKGGGSTVGTLNGAPTFVGGKIVCSGAQGIYYSRTCTAVETYKFKYTPATTGAPPGNVNVFTTWNGTNNNDKFGVTHSPSGTNLRLSLWDSTGAVVISTATTLAGWSPTAAQEYEFEIVVNSTAGLVRVFVDGVLLGTNSPGPWSRGSAVRYYVGASPALYNAADASYDDLIVFDNAQHTTGYTPGYTIDSTIYGEDTIDLPLLAYGEPIGAIQSMQSMAITEVGSPKYTLKGQYWSGAAWAASDGSYSQANTLATINANIGSLDVDEDADVAVQVVFPSSNTLASVDALMITYTGQEYPSEATILTNNSLIAKDFPVPAMAASVTVPVNTDVRYIINVNGTDYYWDGAAWSASDGTFAQANTEADINLQAQNVVSANSTIKIKIVLKSDDNLTSPSIEELSVFYDYGALAPAAPETCQVYGFLLNVNGMPISGATLTFTLKCDFGIYAEAASYVIASSISATTDVNGFFNVALIRSSEFEGANSKYTVEIEVPDMTSPINRNRYAKLLISVPDTTEVNITDQIAAL